MNFWLIIIVGGLITFGIRFSFIYLFGRITMSDWLSRSLRFVPPAVLTAILFPELLIHSGKFDFSFGNTRLLAGILATIVAWRTRSMLWSILVGLVSFWLLQLL